MYFSGAKSRTSHAMLTGAPAGGKRVSGPAALRPARIESQNSAMFDPFGATTPRPVMTTRLNPSALMDFSPSGYSG